MSGQYFGKIKAMYNERNQRIEKSAPTPVPDPVWTAPGRVETFKVFADEAEARETVYKRGQILQNKVCARRNTLTLDEIGRRPRIG